MLRVGITGGIGSGKSTVCQIFEHLGVAVYRADLRAKTLYEESDSLKAAVIAEFGEEIYTAGHLNRARLAQIVFSDKSKLQVLNQLVHPLIFQEYENWCVKHQHDAYTLKEAAIMFESGSYRQLHLIVGVAAPEDIRISRTMDRDGLSKEEVELRIQKQMPQETLLQRCDYVIMNDGRQSLIEQVKNLHSLFIDISERQLPPLRNN